MTILRVLRLKGPAMLAATVWRAAKRPSSEDFSSTASDFHATSDATWSCGPAGAAEAAMAVRADTRPWGRICFLLSIVVAAGFAGWLLSRRRTVGERSSVLIGGYGEERLPDLGGEDPTGEDQKTWLLEQDCTPDASVPEAADPPLSSEEPKLAAAASPPVEDNQSGLQSFPASDPPGNY